MAKHKKMPALPKTDRGARATSIDVFGPPPDANEPTRALWQAISLRGPDMEDLLRMALSPEVDLTAENERGLALMSLAIPALTEEALLRLLIEGQPLPTNIRKKMERSAGRLLDQGYCARALVKGFKQRDQMDAERAALASVTRPGTPPPPKARL